ncbi:PadR family transcriptional regulator [Mesorhizobium sp. M1396]|uniref:PadR family transcriptional regulator n=1 Tax=Mesorhizobium sp. M1396 TaxID=2957095 RepID=UPI00333A1846
MEHRELLSGFVRLHILHHAAEGELYGLWMIEELARHGYRLSPGTLYPLLHGLEKKGYLVSREERDGRTARKFYRATPFGLDALAVARAKARELFGEIMPGVSIPVKNDQEAGR